MKTLFFGLLLSFLAVLASAEGEPLNGQERADGPPSPPAEKGQAGAKTDELPWFKVKCMTYEIHLPKGAPVAKAQFAPGFYDADNKVFYRWKGILFPASKSPYNSPYNRMLTIDPSKDQYTAQEVDPPACYLLGAMGKVAVGYFVKG